jgi:hypothetical protein
MSKVEDKVVIITQAEKKKEKWIFKNEDSLRTLWDNIESINICIIGIPKGEEREKRGQKIIWRNNS